MEYFYIFIAAIFVNNIVLSKFLGICPFIGVSKQLDSAIGMGFAVTFVMTLTSIVAFILNKYVLVALDITYLRTLMFILVIASLVQFVEIILHKFSPSLYKALGIFLPLITTNCAILGIAQINVMNKYNFLKSLISGFASGLGFTLALILMAGLREKVELSKVPASFKGAPMAFILAGLMALAFQGFAGLVPG
jgi:electron transport complex protein RnfA